MTPKLSFVNGYLTFKVSFHNHQLVEILKNWDFKVSSSMSEVVARVEHQISGVEVKGILDEFLFHLFAKFPEKYNSTFPIKVFFKGKNGNVCKATYTQDDYDSFIKEFEEGIRSDATLV